MVSFILMDWTPVVIGTTMFLYIQIFNRTAKLYMEDKTLSVSEFLTKVVQ
jgi:hypothetical protein